MNKYSLWRIYLMLLVTAWSLVACGETTSEQQPLPDGVAQYILTQEPGAPVYYNDVATDGMNWINYRRAQIGLPILTPNSQLGSAAQGHSNYLKTNNTITLYQTTGNPGFTGVTPLNRLAAVGYVFGDADYAYGELNFKSSSTGFRIAEELITSIYTRFVIFEPCFKEIGTGSSSTSNGDNYFTSDLTANNGYGGGIGTGRIVTWPYSGQTGVPVNFFSDSGTPDPVPNMNEVGYPISVHADINVRLNVFSFTVCPRGGAALAARLLSTATNQETPQSAAAIIPLAPLKSVTTYDVTFAGTTDGSSIMRSWSFTTR
ncbi:MAG: CAP domain-containing protein [Desulfuromonadaceae bacterium]|nr:CAP domain-containing protein [Desulfuromonadaceae bacterium]MDD2849153.1 CAP domain-containing protein [Desulfuromonadaceae bacterium]MDD4129521.1 CAP domain-containing protein [Desulfuromonadaceae bacterium]